MSDGPETGARAVDEETTARRVPRDAIAGVAFLVFCLAAWLVTLTFKEAPAVIAQNVQPATFPRMVLLVMAVLAGVVILQSFRKPGKKAKALKAIFWPSAAFMPGFIIAFDLIGILPAMMLLCIFLPLVWGERRLAIIIPYSILFPGAVYFLFVVVLKVHFEPSPLVFW